MPGIDHALQVIRVTTFIELNATLRKSHELRLTAIFAEMSDADRIAILLNKEHSPFNANERSEQYFVGMVDGLFTSQYSRAHILIGTTLEYLVHNDYSRVSFYIPSAIVGMLRAALFCRPLELKNVEFEAALPKVLGNLFGEL